MTTTRERIIRIAHVEDNKADYALLEAMLAESRLPPYEITHFPCPREVLRTGVEGYHMVVTDNDMPAMDGISFVGELRATYKGLVIMLTGSEDPKVEGRAHQAGVDLVLPKRYAADEIDSDSVFHPRYLLPMFVRSII